MKTNMQNRILIIATGGTIASTDEGKGLTPTIIGGSLEYKINELGLEYEISFIHPFAIESPDLISDNWIQLCDVIQENYNDFDGFVVLHGTDTLAYTSSALNYMIQNPSKTIVITGSQYSIDEENTDAIKNVKDSCDFVIKNKYPGVYTVFDGKVIYGARVKKIKSKSYDAFYGLNTSDFAKIENGEIEYYQGITNNEDNTSFYNSISDSVTLINMYPSINPADFDYIANKYNIVVIECFGLGGIPDRFINKIKEWDKQGIIVIVCTQCILEGTNLAKYSVGRELSKLDSVLEAFDMTCEAAFVEANYSRNDFKSQFYRIIHNDYTSI